MLDLNELDTDDIPGVGRGKGVDLARAAAVCLESQGHKPGVELAVRGYADAVYRLTWTPATAQDRRTYPDTNKTTGDGAEAIAVLLASKEIGYTVALTSPIGTGVDYWLGDRDRSSASDVELKQTDELSILLGDPSLVVKKRMEVSGIRRGDDREVRRRTREKLSQTDPSDDTGLPAYAVVVEFGTPLVEITEK